MLGLNVVTNHAEQECILDVVTTLYRIGVFLMECQVDLLVTFPNLQHVEGQVLVAGGGSRHLARLCVEYSWMGSENWRG